MSNLKLYSAWYCPFAQRAWTALLHKNIDFDYIEIDPYKKTPEWMKISRGTGQVPVLIDQTHDITVPGSLRVQEYIDTQFPGEAPPANTETAEAKFWNDFQGSNIIPYFYRFMAAETGSDAAHEAQKHLEAGLENFSAHMDREGPYFFGSEPGGVDIAFAPFALRIDILLSHYKEYALPASGDQWARYHRWWDAMRRFEPLVTTSTGLDNYDARLVEFYLPYTTGGGQADVTEIK